MIPTYSIRLALVDDEQLIVTLLTNFFQRHPDLTITLAAYSAEYLKQALPQQEILPHIVLLDLRMPDSTDTTLVHWLQEHYPLLKIIVVSSHYQKALTGQLFRLGVASFLPKDIHPQELLEAVRQVYQKGYYFLPEQVQIIRQQTATMPPSSTSPFEVITISTREQEVLTLLCQQKTAQEIADVLGVNRRTVEGHKNRLLSKLGAKNTAGLIVYAIKTGIVDLQHLALD